MEHKREKYGRLIAFATTLPPLPTAVAHPCDRIGRELGSLAAAAEGLDVLVFTAGVGEHAAPIREQVCRQADRLGIALDAGANARGEPRISAPSSKVPVWVIPTNEELMIARHTRSVIGTEAL